MSKRPNLSAVVEAAGSTRRTAAPEPAGTAQAARQDPAAPAKPKTRQATKQIAAHFPEEVAWQLRELAVERRTTVQALLGEGLNDLFRKYGKPELAPTESGRMA